MSDAKRSRSAQPSRVAAELLPLSPVSFHILVTVLDRPLHGYAVKREVEERTRGVVKLGAGTLYAAIQRLEDEGLVAETEAPDELREEASSRWRFFRATERGVEAVRAEMQRMESDVEAARRKLTARPAGP